MKLSATRLKTYLTCPRQFRFAYVDEIPAVPTGPLVFGRVIHKTLQLVQTHAMETSATLDLEYATAAFERLWCQALEQENPLFKDGAASIEEYNTLARQILHGYVAVHQDQSPPLVLEFPFALTWGEHVLEGIVDRIDEGDSGLIIVDYKSGKRKPTAHDLQADLQLTIYAFAVEQVFEQPVERIVYYHLREQLPLLTTRSQSDLRRLCDTMLPAVVQAIEAGLFSPRFGWWCRMCHYRELCAAEGPDALPLPQHHSAVALDNSLAGDLERK